MNTFKPTKIDAVILALAVILAYLVNALMDAIMVVKASRGLDLAFLWHGAKYVWAGLTITAGAFLMRHVAWLLFDRGMNSGKEERDVLLQMTLALGFSLIIGFFLWDFAYQELKQIPWYEYPWA